MGRFTRVKMNKQMTRDERAERAIKRMPINMAILASIFFIMAFAAYYTNFEELYIGNAQVLPFAFSFWAIAVTISQIIMGFRFAYHRGFRISSVILPLCHGLLWCFAFLVVYAIENGFNGLLNIKISMLMQIIAPFGSTTALGVILGWISRLLFRRRDI